MIRPKGSSPGLPAQGRRVRPDSNHEATEGQPGPLDEASASSNVRTTTITAATASPTNRAADRPGLGQVGQVSQPRPARIARARAVARPQRAGARKNEKPGSVIRL